MCNDQVLSFYQVRGDKSALLKSQPWAADTALQAAVATSIRLIKSQVDITVATSTVFLNLRLNIIVATSIRLIKSQVDIKDATSIRLIKSHVEIIVATAIRLIKSQVEIIVATSIRLIKSEEDIIVIDKTIKVPVLQRKMQLYLANRETEFILFRPIRSSIISTFVSFISTLR